MSAGILCADTTSASAGTPNSSSTSTAACITGQSESLPITTPTTGGALMCALLRCSRFLGPGRQVASRSPGAFPHRSQVAAESGDVTYFAAGPDCLAVQVHLQGGIGCHHVVQLPVQIRVVAAQQIGHDNVRRGRDRGP